jgi:hypothetical protein
MVGGAPALAAYNYLLGSDCAFSIGPVASMVAITGRHMSTVLKIGQGVANHLAPGGGLTGVFMRRGLFTFSFQTTIAAKETDDIRTLFTNDTEAKVEWAINSGAQAQLTIDITNIHLKVNKLGMDGNMVIWQIEGDQTACLKGTNGPLTASVVNSTGAYLTTPA